MCREQLELVLLTRYMKARHASDDNFEPARFAETYAVMSAQRNTKLLGIFARLNRRDGKPQYLRHLPRIWDLSQPLAGPSGARCAAGTGMRRMYRRRFPDLPLVSRPARNLRGDAA